MSITEAPGTVEAAPEATDVDTAPARDPFSAWFDRLPEWFRTPWSEHVVDRGWRDLFHDVPMTRLETERTDDCFVVRAEIPGVAEDDVDIEVHGDELTIRTTRERRTTSDDGEHHSEFHYGSSRRTIVLPPSARTDDAHASIDGGILEISVPLDADRPSTRSIPIETP